MTNQTTDAINLLLQLGKIGTRVQVLKDSGDLVPDQLFFKSLQERKIAWSDNKKAILISPYVLVLPGKITGLLYVAPSVEDIPPELCLGIVSKHHVLELIFQNSRDRSIWSKGLSLLVANNRPCLPVSNSPSSSLYYINTDITTQWDTNVIHWNNITDDEQHNIQKFYSFLSMSYNGSVFLQYQQKKLKLPQKVLVKLNMNGKQLQCINDNNDIVFQMPFDTEIQIIDSKHNRNKDQHKGNDVDIEEKDPSKHFRQASGSMYCFSIIRKTHSLHIGCYDKQQYRSWRDGLLYLSDKMKHTKRMKVRRAVLKGDFILSPSKKLIESPSRQKHNYHHNEGSISKSKSSGFWGSLFY